jgi:hypothetical protein
VFTRGVGGYQEENESKEPWKGCFSGMEMDQTMISAAITPGISHVNFMKMIK